MLPVHSEHTVHIQGLRRLHREQCFTGLGMAVLLPHAVIRAGLTDWFDASRSPCVINWGADLAGVRSCEGDILVYETYSTYTNNKIQQLWYLAMLESERSEKYVDIGYPMVLRPYRYPVVDMNCQSRTSQTHRIHHVLGRVCGHVQIQHSGQAQG